MSSPAASRPPLLFGCAEQEGNAISRAPKLLWRQFASCAAAFAEATGELAANLATKQDLALLRHELKGDIAQLELRMTVKLGSMMAASIALTATLAKLL